MRTILLTCNSCATPDSQSALKPEDMRKAQVYGASSRKPVAMPESPDAPEGGGRK